MSWIDMKELGGYFELELNKGEHFHFEALPLNSARNCLKYILQAKKPSKIYLPAYCCDSLIEPLISENVDFDFYHTDDKFEICKLPNLKSNERLLYINYFALKSNYINHLYQIYYESLIVDNTQAFFDKPIIGVDTFYSPRKFFGVADGGYLYTKNVLDRNLEQDYSFCRFQQLLGRYEKAASEFYSEYQISERELINQPIKLMSKLTQDILRSLDYEKIALKRQRNFWILHASLSQINLFKKISINASIIPMSYPFYSVDVELRERLIERKIYVAKYWPDALKRTNEAEHNLIENLLLLPVDQRINTEDINRIIEVVNG